MCSRTRDTSDGHFTPLRLKYDLNSSFLLRISWRETASCFSSFCILPHHNIYLLILLAKFTRSYLTRSGKVWDRNDQLETCTCLDHRRRWTITSRQTRIYVSHTQMINNPLNNAGAYAKLCLKLRTHTKLLSQFCRLSVCPSHARTASKHIFHSTIYHNKKWSKGMSSSFP